VACFPCFAAARFKRRCTRLPTGASALEWIDLYFYIAGRTDAFERSSNARSGMLNTWPTGGEQHHNCQAPVRQVLLVSQVFVGGQQDFKAGLFGLGDQLAVFQA
jgi:hypothetical protein